MKSATLLLRFIRPRRGFPEDKGTHYVRRRRKPHPPALRAVDLSFQER
jgi:hypothetical protein